MVFNCRDSNTIDNLFWPGYPACTLRPCGRFRCFRSVELPCHFHADTLPIKSYPLRSVWEMGGSPLVGEFPCTLTLLWWQVGVRTYQQGPYLPQHLGTGHLSSYQAVSPLLVLSRLALRALRPHLFHCARSPSSSLCVLVFYIWREGGRGTLDRHVGARLRAEFYGPLVLDVAAPPFMGAERATNNTAELTALAEGLAYLPA